MNKRYLSTVIACLLGATLTNSTAWAEGTNSRVSVSSTGVQANGDSYHPVLSANGRIVAFDSHAWNLVPFGDTNGDKDVFVHDRDTGTTTRVSVSSQGVEANGPSSVSWISADGRYIAFYSAATNLVDNKPTPSGETFVHDRTTRQTTRVSVGSLGEEICNECDSPVISADGRYLVFRKNLEGLVMQDRNTGQTFQVGLDEGGRVIDDWWLGGFDISADGHFVAFSVTKEDINGDRVYGGIYFRDVWAGQSRLIVGINTEPSMSADGRYVVGGVGNPYAGYAGDRYDGPNGIWLFDTQTQGTEVITTATANIGVISAEGRHVAFVDHNNDVFVYDRQTKTTEGCSVDASGNYSNKHEYNRIPAISADGSVVAWSSAATNLVPNDDNGSIADIIVRDRSVDAIPPDVPPIDSASIIPTLTVRPKAKTSGKMGKFHKYSIQIRNSSGTSTQNTVLVAKVSRNDVSIRAPHACSYVYPRLTCALGNIKPGKKKKIQIKEKAAAPGLLENILWVETDTDTGRKYSYRVTHSAMIK